MKEKRKKKEMKKRNPMMKEKKKKKRGGQKLRLKADSGSFYVVLFMKMSLSYEL